MNAWTRFFPFVAPYWKGLAFSMVMGLGVAVFWQLAILVTFPVIKVFLQGQHLGDYVAAAALDAAEKQAALSTQREAALTQGDQKAANVLAAQLKAIEARAELLNWVQEKIIPRFPKDEFRLLLVIFSVLLVLTTAKGLCTFWQDYLVSNVAEKAVIDLRQAMFDNALKLDPQTIALRGGPRLLANFTYDLQGITQGFSLLSGEIVREPLKAIACLGAAFYWNWQLTGLSLLFLPLAGGLFWWLSKQLKRGYHRVLDSMTRIFKSLEESLSLLKTIHAYGLVGQRRRMFHQQNKDYYQKAMRIVRLDALTSPATEVLGLIAVLAAILPGAYLVLEQRTLDIAELATLYGLLAGAMDPVRKFAKFIPRLKQLSACADRAFEVLDLKSLLHEVDAADVLPITGYATNERPAALVTNSIEFRQVAFSYAQSASQTVAGDTEPPLRILDQLSFTIRAGQFVAVVGENGSGKSTLMGLLARYYDAEEGSLLVDGQPISQIPLGAWRDQLAIVSQEAPLVSGTIRDNIAYGKPNATKSEIELAAEQSYVTEFAGKLPLGLNTPLGQLGQALSGGQRQRIALARALVRNPNLLILDEPTAAIDAVSEELIIRSLKAYCSGRTVFLISHCMSPALLDMVDEVLVLSHGHLIGHGSHQDLLETCPTYQRLYEAQMRRAA